ncbi:MAG: conjugative transposon protein TraM [Gelidibacter sp.]|nr:conjugative transposon protein TraM [Gelidibacter sp.]
MTLEKNKIVFAIVILCIVLFIGGYALMVLGDEEEPTIENNQIPVPKLEDEQKVYESKLDALNDLKDVRQTNAPSIYDERLLDSTGVYDPDLLDKEKMRIVDSIYRHGQITYSNNNYGSIETKTPKEIIKPKRDSILPEIKPIMLPKELGLEHQLFFASNPQRSPNLINKNTDGIIYVRVDGTQTVKTNYRLQMRLEKDAMIDGKTILRNTPIYGFISFKPNRTMISIENINHQSVKLKAFDLQDGSEGIYTENSFRAEAKQEIVVDVVDDINIAGIPQVGGIKKIFQRDNRTVKVMVTDNYKLILKLNKGQ